MTFEKTPKLDSQADNSGLTDTFKNDAEALILPIEGISRPLSPELVCRAGISFPPIHLAITPHLGAIRAAVDTHDVTCVAAGTGTGKTTQLTQELARGGYELMVTQPTRVATESLQAEVERQFGGTNGELVGYKHGRGSLIGKGRLITFCSDGLLLEMLLQEDYFRTYSRKNFNQVIMLDEAHVFNRNIEHILALYRKYLQEGLVPKLVVCSATIDISYIKDFLTLEKADGSKSKIATFEIPGRTFGITDLPRGNSRLDDILEQVDQGRGDVLYFLPGVSEIRKIGSEIRVKRPDAQILTLHGKLPLKEQGKVHESSANPRIILTTNVAETSLTIKDVSTVIDDGSERIATWDGDEEILSLVEISRATYDQRRGRCGRCKEGFHINWGKAPELLSDGHWEMLRVPCHGHTLRLLVAGEDPLSLEFPHHPGPERREAEVAWLKRLGYIDDDSKPTELGEFCARLPLEPREAKIVRYASELCSLGLTHPETAGCLIDAAAILSVRDFRENVSSVPPTDQSPLELMRISDPLGHEETVRAIFSEQNPAVRKRLFAKYGIPEIAKGASGNPPALAPLIDPSLHYLMRISEPLGYVAALETILREEDPAVRKGLLAKHGIRDAAVDEIIFLREEIASRLGLAISPIGSRDLSKLPTDHLREALASPWSDHIFYYAGRDKANNPLYTDIRDPGGTKRKLSRYAEIGEPLLVTGKPFGIGLTLETDDSPAQTRSLINNPCHVPRRWVALNPALSKLERQIIGYQQKEKRVARESRRRRR